MSKKYGINVDKASVSIVGNRISKSKGHGINIVNHADATVKSNTVVESSLHAICFTSSKGTVSKNICKNNKGFGICCVKSGSVKISGNKLSNNKKGKVYKGKGK